VFWLFLTYKYNKQKIIALRIIAILINHFFVIFKVSRPETFETETIPETFETETRPETFETETRKNGSRDEFPGMH